MQTDLKLRLWSILTALTIVATACSSAASPGASSSPSEPVAPTGTQSATPSLTGPSQTPAPAEVDAARDAMDAYLAALVRGDYAAAYAMLAPEAQAAHSLADFTNDSSAFFQSVGGRYTITVWPSDVGPITSWLPPTGVSIDLAHAVLIEVDYPALAGNNAGWELYIVSPGADGLEILGVR